MEQKHAGKTEAEWDKIRAENSAIADADHAKYPDRNWKTGLTPEVIAYLEQAWKDTQAERDKIMGYK